MKKRINISKKDIVIRLICFFVPVSIAALSFYNHNIYPGGVNTLLIYDMRAQLLALYGYIRNGGPGFDSFIHNMSGGLGGGFIVGAVILVIIIYIFLPLTLYTDLFIQDISLMRYIL